MEYDDNISQIPLRTSRDRMIDLLGIGDPFPLRDLQVNHNQKAQFNQQLDIKIVHAQDLVRYTLYDANLMELNPPEQGLIGTGQELVLKTPPITKDSTFRILAERLEAGKNQVNPPLVVAQNFLHYPIVLRVGIDTAVIAFVREAGGPENFLRQVFINYGDYVEVQVGSIAIPPEGFSANAQEEVTYTLVSRFFKDEANKSARLEEVLSIDVPGDDRLEVRRDGKRSDPPLFRTRNLTEGIEIEVKAFEKGAQDIYEYLKSNIRVYVRPNPIRQRSDFTLGDNFHAEAGSNTLSLRDVHLSEAYQCYIRPLNRDEYASDGTPQIPAPENPQSYPIRSDFVSLHIRLLNGINDLLANANLNDEDKAQLQDAANRLQISPPDFSPNSLRELMMTLESAANRAQWPSTVDWVEKEVTMNIAPNQIQRDYVIHVQASKWASAHRYDSGSSVWLDQGFVVQVMNSTQYVLQLLMYPNGVQSYVVQSLLDFHQEVFLQVGFSSLYESDSRWWQFRSQKGLSYQAIIRVNDTEIPFSQIHQGNGTDLRLTQLPEMKLEEDADISIKAFQTQKPEEFIYLINRTQVYVRPNPARAPEEIELLDNFLAMGASNKVTLKKVYPSDHYRLHIRPLTDQEYAADGSPQTPAPQDPSSYPIKSALVSIDERLRQGITHILSNPNLAVEDSTLLTGALTKLQVTPPDLRSNDLRELIQVLHKSDIRAKWPNTVSWIEDPVTLTIPANRLNQDYLIHIEAGKWNGTHQQKNDSKLWLNRSYVVQVMNPTLFAAFSIYLPEAGRNVPIPSPHILDFQERLSFQVGFEAAIETTENWWEGRTQKGMSYQAVIEKNGAERIISDTQAGNGRMLILTQKTDYQFEEDVVVKIKAFQTTKPEEFLYLDTFLHVRVRPNAALSVRLEQDIRPYDTSTHIILNPIQSSVDYEVFAKNLDLLEYQPDGTLEVADHRSIPGLQKIGGIYTGAAGSELMIDTGNRQEDTVFIIKATKRDSQNGESLILDTPLVLRVEPDLAPTVAAEAGPIASGSETLILLNNTQRGVRYQLVDAGDNAIGNPGYHIIDRAVAKIQARREFGMRIGTDFRMGNRGSTPNSLFPDSVLRLPTGSLTQKTIFTVVATKSYTGLSVRLTDSVEVDIT